MKLVNLFWQTLLVLTLLSVQPAWAAVAVLAFEINDTTDLPNDTRELKRTQSIQPALIQHLAKAGQTIVTIPPEAQAAANKGVGYLYDHPEMAAALGQQFKADYVLVGRLQKPSFLFAYLFVRVVDVRQAKVIADLKQEAKGELYSSTQRAVKQLAQEVTQLLAVDSTAFTAQIYRKSTSKAFEDVVEDVQHEIAQHNFRLTEHAKIGEAIAEREGITFPKVSVLHFCNLTYAQALIKANPNAALHMPCRIVIREVDGTVIIETLLLDQQETTAALSSEINAILQDIVDQGAS